MGTAAPPLASKSSASGTLPGNMTFMPPVSGLPVPAELQPRSPRCRRSRYSGTGFRPSARECCDAEQLDMLADPPRRHHHAGCAGSALRGAAPLERLEGTRIEGLYGLHPMPAHLVGRDEAGVHRQPVQVHGAGAALALAAALLRACERQLIAEGVEQAGGGVHPQRHRLPVKGEGDGEGRHPPLSSSSISRSGVSGIALGSAPVARATAFRIAGAGPSIGSSPRPFALPAPCGYGFSRNATRTDGTSSDVGIR